MEKPVIYVEYALVDECSDCVIGFILRKEDPRWYYTGENIDWAVIKRKIFMRRAITEGLVRAAA